MKPDVERKRHVSAKIHQKKKSMRVHLSRDLRKTMKQKRRAVGLRKGDAVKIMRGSHAGKDAKVAHISVADRRVFLEGFTRKTARGKEIMIPFHPSNLMLVSLAESKERTALFESGAFSQKETSKKQKKEKSPVAPPSGAEEKVADAKEKAGGPAGVE